MNNSQVFDLIEKVAGRKSGWWRTPGGNSAAYYDALRREGETTVEAKRRSEIRKDYTKRSNSQFSYGKDKGGNSFSSGQNKAALTDTGSPSALNDQINKAQGHRDVRQNTYGETKAKKRVQVGPKPAGRMVRAKESLALGGTHVADAKALGVERSSKISRFLKQFGKKAKKVADAVMQVKKATGK